MKPKRIYLIRHGESEGNVDNDIYKTIPDWKIKLTDKGKEQSHIAANKIISDTISSHENYNKPKELSFDFMFYVSPWYRTRQTASVLMENIKQLGGVVGYREDPRLREQGWGNYKEDTIYTKIQRERNRFGTFFYVIPQGESGAEVYDRISTFFETVHRDFKKTDFPENMVIVTHGLTLRLFLMRWFHWTVEEFESLKNPRNCEVVKMELVDNEKYRLVSNVRKRGENYAEY